MATTFGRPGLGRTVALRRQSARIVAGKPEGGYTGLLEISRCHCGDDSGLDYRDVGPQLQRIRGPCSIGAGLAAYEQHLKRHLSRQ